MRGESACKGLCVFSIFFFLLFFSFKTVQRRLIRLSKWVLFWGQNTLGFHAVLSFPLFHAGATDAWYCGIRSVPA
ncbi:uncharacterized protein F4812DRAFT_402217 [Daldinia caldariorum]|uniref:uncharacterized protein n=1 Tax=Daldinia caldariorum TaxID=326644 RepID=UPI0020072CB6|nr:uncharacterized protein F4812DRAFT_402217 [Daldinia caldariorum]KAI1467604.1 hypothetical protein F4812DRAFT_402217 [Daldinia caldariorum]